MPFILPIVLFLVPLLEIALFIIVGRQIGVLPTIGLVLVAAITGGVLLRLQGMATLLKARRELEAGRLPARQMFDAGMIVAAGVLLVVPGFITDAIGLALFLPFVRGLAWRLLSSRFNVGSSASGDARRRHGAKDVVELGPDEFEARSNAANHRRNAPLGSGPANRGSSDLV